MLPIKTFVKNVPIIGRFAQGVYNSIRGDPIQSFKGSQQYWERRYADGGDSGVGSYGRFAEFKAEIVNNFVVQNHIETIIEFGCGDGNQLLLAQYPQYLGIDVSRTAIEMCRQRFFSDRTKQFFVAEAYAGETAELALSLDVIYHLVEDDIFDDYMNALFSAATRFVVIYSSNKETNESDASHVLHRKFTDWIERHTPNWSLCEVVQNKYPYKGDYTKGSFSDFYFYRNEK